jgi:hypothetical protein
MSDEQPQLGRCASDNRWHVGKEIPVLVIMSLVIVLISNVVMWSAFMAEVKSFMVQSDYKKLVIAFLDDVVRPLAQKTDTQFDDNAVNAINDPFVRILS